VPSTSSPGKRDSLTWRDLDYAPACGVKGIGVRWDGMGQERDRGRETARVRVRLLAHCEQYLFPQ
jgi:hypothetical protein